MKFTQKQIKEFLDAYGIKSSDDEDDAIVELMMDDHTYIEYEGQGYYIPECGSGILCLETVQDHEEDDLIEYINEKYSLN